MKYERSNKVLITGAAGFIGTNLTLECLRRGWDVLAVDHDAEACERLLDLTHSIKHTGCFKLYRTDFQYGDFLHEARQYDLDVVLHLAALPRVSYSVEHPSSTTLENVANTVTLLEWAENKPSIKRFVFASSSAIYGGAEELPTQEFAKSDPKSPYALQKVQGEQWMQMFNRMYGLDTVSLRFFNVFGPHQLGDSPYSTAIAAWCQRLKDGQPLRLDGTGEQSRDMCYVDNTVQACLLAAESKDNFNGAAYNVACGQRYSLNEILDWLRKRYEFDIEHAPPRKGDVMHTQADISRIQAEMGYKPTVEFWDGLEKTLQWWGLTDPV